MKQKDEALKDTELAIKQAILDKEIALNLKDQALTDRQQAV